MSGTPGVYELLLKKILIDESISEKENVLHAISSLIKTVYWRATVSLPVDVNAMVDGILLHCAIPYAENNGINIFPMPPRAQ